MAAPKRTRAAKKASGEVVHIPDPMVREAALVETWRLHCLGYSQYTIGQKLGVSQGQVCMDLKVMKARALADLGTTREELTVSSLATIAAVKREAWEAWERSKAAAPGSNEEDDKERPRRPPVGCGEFLHTILEAEKQVAALLGLNAPKKVDVNGTMLTLDYAAMMTRSGLDGPVEDVLEKKRREIEARVIDVTPKE